MAFVRGLAHLVGRPPRPGGTGVGAPPDEDLFANGAVESFRAGQQSAIGNRRRTVRQFSAEPVHPDLIARAVADAMNAPAPHHTTPWRFAHIRGATRTRLLDAMADRWRHDLAELDGFTAESIDKRLRRGDVLRNAPELVVPFVALAGSAHTYPDRQRRYTSATCSCCQVARRCRTS